MTLITPGILASLTSTAATPQTTSLPIITIPTDINPGAASALIPAAPCGLDVNMEGLKGSIDGLKSQISGLTSGAGGIADQLSSLGGDLADKVNGLADSLSNAIGEIKLPSLDLGSEISALLGSFGSGDSFGIAAKIASIRANFPDFDISGMLDKLSFTSEIESLRASFPDFDISGMLDKLSLGTFNPCTDVPNMKIIDGKVVEDAIAAVAPARDALKAEIPAELPIPTIPPFPIAKFIEGYAPALKAAIAGAQPALQDAIAGARPALQAAAAQYGERIAEVKPAVEAAIAEAEPKLKAAIAEAELELKAIIAEAEPKLKEALAEAEPKLKAAIANLKLPF